MKPFINMTTAFLLWIGLVSHGFMSIDNLPLSIQEYIRPFLTQTETLRLDDVSKERLQYDRKVSERRK